MYICIQIDRYIKLHKHAYIGPNAPIQIQTRIHWSQQIAINNKIWIMI